jgi:hypothetical protein
MTQEQIDELRKLAQAATPGPWVVNGDPLVNEGAPHLMTEDGYAIADFWGNESSLGLKGNERNADYIAAANPAAILALIQQRDELLAALKDARELVDDWGAYAPAYMQEKHDLAGDLDRLYSVIVKAEAQS